MGDIGAEAVELANKIERVCRGHTTAATYIAISMVLGASATLAARPDLDGLMELIAKGAKEEFDRREKQLGERP